jgi:hypothetical protein
MIGKFAAPSMDGRFAIQKLTFTTRIMNGGLGSTPALRSCHMIERFCDADEGQPSAKSSRSSHRWPTAAYR